MSSRIYYSHEAEQQVNREKAVIAGFFFLLGIGAGSLLTLLFAPKSGFALREEIEERVQHGVQSLEQEVAELRKRLEQESR